MVNEPEPKPETDDKGLTFLIVLLWVQFGAFLVLFAVSYPIYWARAAEEGIFPDLPPALAGLAMTLIVGLVYAPLGVGSAVAARGLRAGTSRGYWSALVVSVLSFACCGCLPLGVYGLIYLQRATTRARFFPGDHAEPAT